MARCNFCDEEMTDAATVTCSWNSEVEYNDCKTFPAIPYDASEHGGQRCHDCYVADGGYHHPGCDMERCPRCGGQLISCDCGVA